ncbi:hypothetical protein [Algoriphagus resistens]|uniref:hypothetical protein n=1 Tax=Algoriphagus resistens TaxID=1750590 RepID=UPI000716AE94|nr:hypothetical protein [Algoriphagus resistens]
MEAALNIHQKIAIRALAKEFPEIGRKEMGERFLKLRIGVTGDLLGQMDFRGKVLVNGLMIEVEHLYYGIFPDLAVGRGQGMDDGAIAKLVGGGRKKKNWTRGLASMRHRLGELYASVAADEISQHVNKSYDRTLRFRF